MARNERISRIIAVASALAASRRGVALRALAERHGWNLRALYRDVETLERAGIPIISEGQRYRISETWRFSLPLAADADELMALFVAREQSLGWRTTSLGRALDRLCAKALVPSVTKAPQTQPWLVIRSPLGIDYSGHRVSVAVLEQSLRDRCALDATYQAISTGEITKRTIEPGELYWDPGLEALYLIGYCRLRCDLRVFAVHRFKSVSLLSQPVMPRAGVSSKAALRDAFRLWRAERSEHVRILFSPLVAERIRERKWHASQSIEASKDGGVILSMDVAGLDEIKAWILSFGAEARALAPKSLVAMMGEALARAAKAYRAGGSLTANDNGGE